MPTAIVGYSGTPLPKKLGLKEGGVMVLLNAPVGIEQWMQPLPAGAALVSKLASSNALVVLFCRDKASLKNGYQRCRKNCLPMAACGFHGQRKHRNCSSI